MILRQRESEEQQQQRCLRRRVTERCQSKDQRAEQLRRRENYRNC